MKRSVVAIITLLLVSIYGYRIYEVNKDVPAGFNVEKVSVNEWFAVDNFSVKVTDVKIGESTNVEDAGELIPILPVDVTVEIKNTSGKTQSGMAFVESALFSGNASSTQSRDIDIDKEIFKSIQPEQTKSYVQHFRGYGKSFTKDKLTLVVSRKLYEKMNESSWQKGNYLGIIVDLTK